MAVLLALISALAYGASDFVSGLATKKANEWAVGLGVAVAGLIVVGLGLLIVDGELTGRSVLFGVLAGIGNSVGTVALYRGLALGAMNVVAPLSGVIAAVLPVAVGLLTGDRPAALALVGIVLALVSILAVSLAPAPKVATRAAPAGDPGTADAGAVGEGAAPAAAPTAASRSTRGVTEGVVAGLGFGLIFVGLGRAGDGVGLWPTFVSEVVAVALLLGAALIAGALKVPRSTVAPIFGAGVLAAVAVVTYQLAVGAGLLTLVSVITALYPALTVVFAAVFLHERSTRLQLGGMATAVVAVVLITVA